MVINMEMDSMIPIVLGSDRGLAKELAELCGAPVYIIDRKFSFFDILSPSRRLIKLCSPELVRLYIEDIIKNTDKTPLLAVSDDCLELIGDAREELSELCILWHKDFKF